MIYKGFAKIAMPQEIQWLRQQFWVFSAWALPKKHEIMTNASQSLSSSKNVNIIAYFLIYQYSPVWHIHDNLFKFMSMNCEIGIKLENSSSIKLRWIYNQRKEDQMISSFKSWSQLNSTWNAVKSLNITFRSWKVPHRNVPISLESNFD